jgi:hypothetical protein
MGFHQCPLCHFKPYITIEVDSTDRVELLLELNNLKYKFNGNLKFHIKLTSRVILVVIHRVVISGLHDF